MPGQPLQGVVSSFINGCQFGFYTADQIRKISVLCITSPVSLDELGTPVRGGLYDPTLGPTDELETCQTCGLKAKFCPGHMGHVELAYPVYHPLMFNLMYKLLRCVCFNCHRFLLPEGVVNRYKEAFQLLRKGELLDAFKRMDETPKLLEEGDEEKEEEFVPDIKLHSHIAYQQHCLFLDFFRKVTAKKCSHCNAYVVPLTKRLLSLFSCSPATPATHYARTQPLHKLTQQPHCGIYIFVWLTGR